MLSKVYTYTYAIDNGLQVYSFYSLRVDLVNEIGEVGHKRRVGTYVEDRGTERWNHWCCVCVRVCVNSFVLSCAHHVLLAKVSFLRLTTIYFLS